MVIAGSALALPVLGVYRALPAEPRLGGGDEALAVVVVAVVLAQVALLIRDQVGHQGSTRTATTRLDTERALRASVERLRAVARQMPVVLLACDADGTCTVSEGLALAHLGLRPGELVGQPLRCAPLSCQPLVGLLEAMRTGGDGALPVDVVPEGRTFQVTASAVGPEGGPYGLLALATDVTDRVLQEQRLQGSAHRQRVNAEISATILVTTLDADRLVDAVVEKASEVLAAACAIVSYRGDEKITARMSGEPWPTFVEVVGFLLSSGSAILTPSVLTDGGARPLREGERAWSVAFPLHVEGSSSGILAAFREQDQPPFDAEDYSFLFNVAERTWLALENFRLFADLRHELSERRRSEEVLRESEQRWRAFGTEASHQLRTPLTGLRLRIDNELAECGPASPTPERWRSILAETLQHLDNLESTVHDLLALVPSRYASIEPLDVAVLLDGMAATWGSLIEASGRQFVLSAETELPPAMISGSAVRQVLGVLLDNALRHGAGCITLVAKDLAGSVALEVHDEGLGFPSPDGTTPEESDGRTGHQIGLSLARSLAEAGGARLQLSHPGPCPTVSLFLPGCASDVEPATGHR